MGSFSSSLSSSADQSDDVPEDDEGEDALFEDLDVLEEVGVFEETSAFEGSGPFDVVRKMLGRWQPIVAVGRGAVVMVIARELLVDLVKVLTPCSCAWEQLVRVAFLAPRRHRSLLCDEQLCEMLALDTAGEQEWRARRRADGRRR